MTGEEWVVLSERISLLWPPAMTPGHVDAYWSVLEPLDARQLDLAITLIARQARPYRPDAGLLYETAMAQQRSDLPALPAAVVDPLSEQEHLEVLAELHERQDAEHARRTAAVVDLLHATGYRVPVAELPVLMATSRSEPEVFDGRMTFHRNQAWTVTGGDR